MAEGSKLRLKHARHRESLDDALVVVAPARQTDGEPWNANRQKGHGSGILQLCRNRECWWKTNSIRKTGKDREGLNPTL